MPRTSKKGLVEQIAANAKSDQAIVTITDGKGKMLLPVEGKLNVKGDYAYVSFPAIQGFYKKGTDGNLTKATPGDDAESLFFPERAAELAAKAAEIAQLKELARKHGFSLSASEGAAPRQRAPRGSKPKSEPKPMPKKGDKFTSTQNGITYTIEAVDGKTLKMKGEDGSKKEVTYSGIFWRWHTAVK